MLTFEDLIDYLDSRPDLSDHEKKWIEANLMNIKSAFEKKFGKSI